MIDFLVKTTKNGHYYALRPSENGSCSDCVFAPLCAGDGDATPFEGIGCSHGQKDGEYLVWKDEGVVFPSDISDFCKYLVID